MITHVSFIITLTHYTMHHIILFLEEGGPFVFCIELLSSRQKCLDTLTDQPSISFADAKGNYKPRFTLSFIFYSSKPPCLRTM